MSKSVVVLLCVVVSRYFVVLRYFAVSKYFEATFDSVEVSCGV